MPAPIEHEDFHVGQSLTMIYDKAVSIGGNLLSVDNYRIGSHRLHRQEEKLVDQAGGPLRGLHA